jgi:hypothetical protein
LDFFVARGVAANYVRIESVFELSSDHSPIIATVGAHGFPRVFPPTLVTHNSDWKVFRAYITDHMILNLRIKQCSELEDATHYFTTLLQEAAWHSTHPPRMTLAPVHTTPIHIRNLFAEKRRARSRWQRSRNQGDRAIYNSLKRNLQTALKKARNATLEQFITSLSPDDTSLWKATKSFKRPQVSIPSIRKSDGSWTKSDTEKATAFWDQIRRVFTPYSSSHPHDLVVSASLDVPCPMALPVTPFSPAEVSAVTARLNVHKASNVLAPKSPLPTLPLQ